MLALLASQTAPAATLDTPSVALTGIAFDITVSEAPARQALILEAGEQRWETAAGDDGTAMFPGIELDRAGPVELRVTDAAGNRLAGSTQRVLPAWVSILPPAVAIALALALKSVIPSLFLGIWLGATALERFTPGGALAGALSAFDTYVADSLADRDHVAIVLFSMMIGGMVGIVSRAGGMAAIVSTLMRYARSAASAQVSIWAMGL
ncbi:MAG: Na+/H+ antiporter NhaC family protein, partial [Pseudomonadota bacterium]